MLEDIVVAAGLTTICIGRFAVVRVRQLLNKQRPIFCEPLEVFGEVQRCIYVVAVKTVVATLNGPYKGERPRSFSLRTSLVAKEVVHGASTADECRDNNADERYASGRREVPTLHLAS